MNWHVTDYQYMALALKLAKKGIYTARPNPMVGCVLVKDNQIVGEGWHESFGKAHAEVNALNLAGKQANASTCYVTLEPCAHHGKTGPCAKALIKAGVKKVICAMRDPNPQVAGKGIQLLVDAGIQVEVGLLESQARTLNKGFVSRFERKRPWITVKLAMSLDGRTALADGSSKWITGPSARSDVQLLRAKHDAIATGIGTLLADNPSMTVRPEDVISSKDNFLKDNLPSPENNIELNALSSSLFRQPTRILFDSNSKANLNAKFFSPDAPVIWNTSAKSDASDESKIATEKPASHISETHFDSLQLFSEYCASKEMNRVLVEAGHQLAGAFLKAGLVDELIVYMAPKLMGNCAQGLFDLNITKMQDCPQLALQDVRQFDQDVRLRYYPCH